MPIASESPDGVTSKAPDLPGLVLAVSATGLARKAGCGVQGRGYSSKPGSVSPPLGIPARVIGTCFCGRSLVGG